MGRGDVVGVFRFLALLGMTRGGTVLLSPSAPVSGTGTGFDSSPIKGEGGFGRLCWLVHPRHTPPLWIADQVRNDVVSCPVLWILP